MKMSDLRRRVKENASASATSVGSIATHTGTLGQVADTVKKNKKRRKVGGIVIIRR